MTTATRTRRPVGRLMTGLRPEAPRLALGAVLAALTLGCAIGLMATSGWLISRASQRPPVLSLGVAVVAVRAFGIGRGFFRYTERLVSHDAAFRSLTGLRVQTYRRLERLAPTGLSAFRRGDLLARLVADVDAAQDLPLRVLLPGAAAVLAGGASVAVTWWLLPAAGVVLLVALLVGGLVVPWLTVVTGSRAQRDEAPARGDLTAQVTDLLRSAPDLVACGAVDAALAVVRDTDARLTATRRRASGALGLAAAFAALVAGAAVLGALLAGIPAVGDGRLPGVDLAVVVLLPLAAYESVVSLPAAALALVGVRASAERLAAIGDAPDPVVDPVEPRALPVSAVPELRLRGVSARWPGATRDALHDVDLTVAQGRRVAVVGTSGAGKSTLVAVLLRFLEHDGAATLDDIELSDLAADDVRSVVGLCAQDAHVFDATIEANLRVGRPEASADELRAVLGRVRLLPWVDALPDGIATTVGEHGGRMSGGQRQRLALARALLADRPVLVLDEPTEHLDEPTAAALTSDLLDLTRGRSTLLVTHRLTGLEEVDEIVVLEAGRVVERGTHEELVVRGGRYAELYAREREYATTVLREPDRGDGHEPTAGSDSPSAGSG